MNINSFEEKFISKENLCSEEIVANTPHVKEEAEFIEPIQDHKKVDLLQQQLKSKAIKVEGEKYYFANDVVLSENDINTIAQQGATIEKTKEVKQVIISSSEYIVKLKDKEGKYKINVYKKDVVLGAGNFSSVNKVIKIGNKEKVAIIKKTITNTSDPIDETSNLIFLRMSKDDREKGIKPLNFIKTPEGKKIAKTSIKGIIDAPYFVIDNRNKINEKIQNCGYIGKLYDGTVDDLVFKELKDYNVFFKGMLDILEGIEYLHQNDFVHGDLKNDNILFENKNESINFYLADFGGGRTKAQLLEPHPVYKNCINIPVCHLNFIGMLEGLDINEQKQRGMTICKNLDIYLFIKALFDFADNCDNSEIKNKVAYNTKVKDDVDLWDVVKCPEEKYKELMFGEGFLSIDELRLFLKILLATNAFFFLKFSQDASFRFIILLCINYCFILYNNFCCNKELFMNINSFEEKFISKENLCSEEIVANTPNVKEEAEFIEPIQDHKKVDLLQQQLKSKAIKVEGEKYYFANDVVLSENDINTIAQQGATIEKTKEVKQVIISSSEYIVKLKDKEGKHKINVYKKDVVLGAGNFSSVNKVIKIGNKEKVAIIKKTIINTSDPIDETSNLIFLRMSKDDREKGIKPLNFIKTPEGKKIAKTSIKGIIDAPYFVIDNRNKINEKFQNCGYIGKLYDGTVDDLVFKELKDYNVFFKGMLDILEGIEYLHQNDFVHGDLKNDNILFENKNESINFYLADFGGGRTKAQLLEPHPVYKNCINIPVCHLNFIEMLEGLDINEQKQRGMTICKNLDIYLFIKALFDFADNCDNSEIKNKVAYNTKVKDDVDLWDVMNCPEELYKELMLGEGFLSIDELRLFLKNLISD